MLAERLNRVAYEIYRHARHVSLLEKFEGLVEAVRRAEKRSSGEGDEPSRPPRNKRIEESLQPLADALSQDRVNKFTPSDQEILEEIGGWRLSGNRLLTRIQEVLQQPAFDETPVGSRLAGLYDQTERFLASTKNLVSGFDALDVDRATVPTGERVEVGALFPIEMNEASLHDVREAIEGLEDNLRWVSEVAGDTPGQTRVRAVGSSGLEVFLDTPLGLAATIGIIIESCQFIILMSLKIAEKYRDLSDSDAPEEFPEEHIEAQVNTFVDQRLDALVEDLMSRYSGDEGRANEIRIGLEPEVRYFFEVMSQGGKLEVRVIPPSEADEDEEVSPGFGNMRDMKRRGRVMAEGEAPQLSSRDSRLLIEAADRNQVNDEEEAEGDDGEKAEKSVAEVVDALDLDDADDGAPETEIEVEEENEGA